MEAYFDKIAATLGIALAHAVLAQAHVTWARCKGDAKVEASFANGSSVDPAAVLIVLATKLVIADDLPRVQALLHSLGIDNDVKQKLEHTICVIMMNARDIGYVRPWERD